jgi:hypothetical protein
MSALADEYPSTNQRIAICMKQFRGGKTVGAYEDIAGLVDALNEAGKL